MRLGISFPHAAPDVAHHFEQTAQNALVNLGDATKVDIMADGHGVTLYADVVEGCDEKIADHLAMLNAQEDESTRTFLIVRAGPATPAHH